MAGPLHLGALLLWMWSQPTTMVFSIEKMVSHIPEAQSLTCRYYAALEKAKCYSLPGGEADWEVILQGQQCKCKFDHDEITGTRRFMRHVEEICQSLGNFAILVLGQLWLG